MNAILSLALVTAGRIGGAWHATDAESYVVAWGIDASVFKHVAHGVGLAGRSWLVGVI